jgi:hypothetical protein
MSYTKGATFSSTATNNNASALDAELAKIAAASVISDANIATNTADIATNVADIATNTADIATNTSDISTLETAVGTGISNTLGASKLVGYDFDSTSAASSSGASWTACSVTVPANTATNGLKVTLSMQFDGPGVGAYDGLLPLRMKVGAAAAEDLSSSGSRDARFEVVSSCINGGGLTQERTMWIDATTTSGLTTPFSKTAIVILYAGAAWNVGSAGTISNVSMVVEAV